MKIEVINDKFFGDEKTHRYLIDIYRECVEKLIVANVLVEVWGRTKGSHEHVRGKNCNQCAIFFQVYFSCVDSLFLHLRLLFSAREPNLADSFLNAVKGLNVDDFKLYYSTKYEHDVTENEQKAIEPLFTLAKDNLTELSKLYIKRIEPYQAFAFHQPEDSKYYEVSTIQKDGEGIKYITHTKRSKFKRDLVAAKEMLGLIAEVIHEYLRLSSKYYYTLNIYPQNYVKEIVALLGVEISEETMSEIISNTTKHTQKMIHVIGCSGGLNSHNGLEYAKIRAVEEASAECP